MKHRTALLAVTGAACVCVLAAPVGAAAPAGPVPNVKTASYTTPTQAFHTGARSVGAAPLHPKVRWTGFDTPSQEPSMGIDRRGRVIFSATIRQYHGLTNGGYDSFSGAFVTTDGESIAPIGPRVGDRNDGDLDLDPYTYVDPATGRAFVARLTGTSCAVLGLSDDVGATWTPAVAGCDQNDHETIFAGPPPAGAAKPTGYPNVVYYCSISGGELEQASTLAACSRSLDGGRTFLLTASSAFRYDPSVCPHDPVVSGCDGPTGHGVVAPDGTVYLPKNYNGRPHVSISRDEGDTWTLSRVSSMQVATNADGYPDHEAAVATDVAGNVYVGWVGRDRQPYLAASTDGGKTWRAPQRIGVAGLHQSTHIAVDALGVGKVAVHYLASFDAPRAPFPDDSTCGTSDPAGFVQYQVGTFGVPLACARANDPYAKTTWTAVLLASVNALAVDPTFYAAPVTPAKDPLLLGICGPGGPCRSNLDFQDVRISPRDGSAWSVMADNCPASDCRKARSGTGLAHLTGIDLR